jgi:hypothetical protein
VRRVAIALAVVTLILGIRFGTFAAGGADSYGYVSQADLWLQGSLIVEQPLGRDADWPDAVWTLAPLGYRPTDERGMMVPIYPPGLPMLMAVFKAIGGADAVYYVVPLLGALAVWLTFVLGTRLAGPGPGALAASALAVSPAFLFQLVSPMSDVPVTAWWLLAIILALGRPPWSSAASGLAASAAILTRPNLVILGALVLLLVMMGDREWRERIVGGASCGLLMAVGVLAVAATNQHLYGSPLTSGYGSFEEIYAGGNLWPNLARYPRWLVETQTPFVLLALGAPLLLVRGDGACKSRIAWWGIVFALAVFAAYAWYVPYDNWTFLRFLLPAYPIVLVLAAASFDALITRSRLPRAPSLIVAALALGAWGLYKGQVAFDQRDQEARYRIAGAFARGLPDNAIVLANQHSGSIRYYANRITLRFELLAPGAYNEALAYLHASERPVFAVLDSFERKTFRERYAAVADLSWLDRKPLIVTAERVYFYKVTD